MNNNHYHGIEVKFLPPSNFRDAKLKLTSYRFSKSITLKWNDIATTSDDIVTLSIELLKQHGYDVVGFTQLKKGYLILVEQFEWKL